MINKEAIQQQAEAIVYKLDAIARRYNSEDYGLPIGSRSERSYSFKTMVNAVEHILMESGCAPVGEAPQKMGIGKLRALLHAFDSEQISMSKFLEEINIHFLGGENYGTEASNTDEAPTRKRCADIVQQYFKGRQLDNFYSSVAMYPDDVQDLMNLVSGLEPQTDNP